MSSIRERPPVAFVRHSERNEQRMPRTATLASGTGRNSGRQSGKERILNAAMLLFARMPYCDTSLRDIAAAAEVDVAYVHRSFGSKAEIFRHALAALDPLDDIMVATDGRSMISRLCDLAFLRDPRIQEDVRPLHLLIQSSLCSEARDIIAQFIDTSLALPLSKAFGFENPGRAHFALSLLSGFVTHRAVMGPANFPGIPEADQRRMLETALTNAMCDTDGRSGPVDKSADIVLHSPSGVSFEVKIACIRALDKDFLPQAAPAVAQTAGSGRIRPRSRCFLAQGRRFSAQRTDLSSRFRSV